MGTFSWPRTKRLTVAALTSKVLCERHNNALSPLDTAAAEAFSVLRDFEARYRDSEIPPRLDFVLASGPLLEAWCLKAGFGLIAARLVRLSGDDVTGWRDGSDEMLLDVLFGTASMPANWGLWINPPSRAQAASADLAIEVSGLANELWSVTFEFGAFPFTLALGKPGGSPTLRPGALVLLKEGAESQQSLLLGWPDGMGAGPVISTRIGQMNGWDQRS